MFLIDDKGINRLISKRISNIYLKVTIERKLVISKFRFSKSKKLSPGQFFGSYNSRRYHGMVKGLVAT